MTESAELLCDDWAIARTGDGVQFAKSLAELAGWVQGERQSVLVASMVGERPLVRRVRRALEGDPRRFEQEDGHRPTRLLFGVGTLAALIMVAPGAVDASPPKHGDQADKKADKKADKQGKKGEREAAKAEEKAREAREKAEQARREAEQAQREAEEARRKALGITGNSSLHIQDGDESLRIDAGGIQLRSKDADIDVTQDGHMRLRVHDGQTNIDLDLDLDDLEGLEGLAEQFMGDMFGQGFGGGFGGQFPPTPPQPPRGPQGVPAVPQVPTNFGPGFDPDAFESEMEAWAQEMERWAEQFEDEVDERDFVDDAAIERELEQRIRELEQLRQRRQQQGNNGPATAPLPPSTPMLPTPPIAPVAPLGPAAPIAPPPPVPPLIPA